MKLHTLTLILLVLLILIANAQDAVSTNITEPERISKKLVQGAGSLQGTVTDSSGAVIPGVRVTLELPQGGQRVTTTSDDGSYRFAKVEFGSGYRLRFSYPGFRVVEKTNIQVQMGQAISFDAVLAIGPPPPSPRPTVHPTPRPSPPPPSPSPPPTPRPTPQPSVNPSPGPSPFPTASPTPSPPGQDWDVIVAREIQKLHDSKILFNPPLDMQQGKAERVEVRISAEEIGAALNQDLKGRGAPQVEPIKVSPIMKVTLIGDGKAFNIEPRSDEEQIVAGKPYAEWSWDVTPLESGAHTLSLKVVAVVHIAERGEKASDIPVGDKPIHVRISPWYATKRFVGNNWQWLWTVIVFPGGGLLWGLRRKKTRRAAGFK